MRDFRLELEKDEDCFWLARRFNITEDLTISIQANEFAYCLPRTKNDSYTDYFQLELGFPNFTPPDYIMEYADDPDDPQETVYGYVPYELIQRMIDELRGAAC